MSSLACDMRVVVGWWATIMVGEVGVFGLGTTYARFALKASSADMGSAAPDTPLPDGINVKFVADPRDVDRAQQLSYASIAGDAGRTLAGGDDQEDKKVDEDAMKAAMQKFNETTIPLFTIAQIQVRRSRVGRRAPRLRVEASRDA